MTGFGPIQTFAPNFLNNMEKQTMKTDATKREILEAQEKSVARDAFLPFEEKISILIRMQNEAQELFRIPP